MTEPIAPPLDPLGFAPQQFAQGGHRAALSGIVNLPPGFAAGLAAGSRSTHERLHSSLGQENNRYYANQTEYQNGSGRQLRLADVTPVMRTKSSIEKGRQWLLWPADVTGVVRTASCSRMRRGRPQVYYHEPQLRPRGYRDIEVLPSGQPPVTAPGSGELATGNVRQASNGKIHRRASG